MSDRPSRSTLFASLRSIFCCPFPLRMGFLVEFDWFSSRPIPRQSIGGCGPLGSIRKEIQHGAYQSRRFQNISQVIGKGKAIKSLEGLQHCKALMKIDLANNEISDLTPIAELKQLQSIDLSGNQIESLAPLTGLIQSQYLQLSKNKYLRSNSHQRTNKPQLALLE